MVKGRLLLIPVLLIVAGLSGCLASPAPIGGEPTVAWGPPFPQGVYDFDGPYSKVLEEGPHGILPLSMNYLASDRGGVDVQVGVWFPDVPEGMKVPVVVDAGPYYGNDGAPMEDQAGHLGRLVDNLVPHGYAVAGIAVRGTGGSGGCMDLMGPSEVADLSQAVTWLGTQPWSNGNVGMVGLSYDGSTPWMVARTGNPHLKTIVPISGVPDVYELMFRNGTAEIRGPALLNALYYSYAVRNNMPLPQGPEDLLRQVEHTAEGLACTDHAVGLFASLYSGVDGGRDPTGYWAPRNAKPDVEANYKGSILMVQGLQDWNVDPGLNLPWADQLNRTGIPVHHMLGQWGHTYPDGAWSNPGSPNMRWDWAEHLKLWFDRWLKEDTTIELGAPVQVLDAMDRWRQDDSWPPRDATWTKHQLRSDGTLGLEAGSSSSVLLLPQPLGGENLAVEPLPAPGAYADFLGPVQEEDLLISGLPKVHVTVTPQASGGSLAAWLYRSGPDGNERIGWTMINLKFADGTDEPASVTPGEPLEVKMEVQPMDAVVPKGERLLLRVWQYRDDPSGSVHGRLPSVPAGPMELELGQEGLSVLKLPTIERGPEVYFEPPRPKGASS